MFYRVEVYFKLILELRNLVISGDEWLSWDDCYIGGICRNGFVES